jgi:L-aspartate oxidase
MPDTKQRETDFVIIGCGIAGLRAAVELADTGARVLVLTKADLTESNTQYAQGGIAAALSDEDEIFLHYQDTVAAGDGLCHEEAVKLMVEEGPHYIQELVQWGTEFDRDGTKLAFTREGAHSRSRVLHAHGDSTGRELTRALFARANSLQTIEFLQYAFTTDLLMEGSRVSGVRYLDEPRNQLEEIRASAVLLATGGLGQLYSETTNPSVATGDGIAIACRAGAVLSDMEFIQFHPTALYMNNAPRFLLSEALRGEGGQLRNINLERFMPHYSPEAELAPRDIVSRAIMTELHKAGGEFVYLDMTGKKRFPRIYQTCLELNLDITNQLIPVRPAAHYAMGGVATDLDGRTNLEGLFAAGEAACTGVHGANRLASNSLLEGLVFGARTGRAMAEGFEPAGATGKNKKQKSNNKNYFAEEIPPDVATWLEHIRGTMWKNAGILRNAQGMEEGLDTLLHWERPLPEDATRAYYEAANLLLAGELVIRSALARQESRGAHYRDDFPFQPEADCAKHSYINHDQKVCFK